MCMKAKKDTCFTLKQLSQLHHTIADCNDQNIENIQVSYLCKNIQSYCEMIVWGEKYNEDFFDYFCQSKMISTFYHIFSKIKQKDILISILQGLSVILINISKADSVTYLFSHQYFMNFQTLKLKEINTELAQYYINFLKTIASRLDKTNIHIFFNQKFSNFPLLWQAIKFYNHPQPLIRNTSKNIVLSVVSLHATYVDRYLRSFPFVIYYSHIMNHIKSNWKYLNNLEYKDQISFQRFQRHLQDDYDIILYVQDLMRQSNQEAKLILINSFVNELLISTITQFNPKSKFKIKLFLYHIWLILEAIEIKEISEIIVLLIFGKYLKVQFCKKVKQLGIIQPIISYQQKWSFSGFWDEHQSKINQMSKRIFAEEIQIEKNLSDSTSFTNESTCIEQLSQSFVSIRSSKIISKRAMNLFGIDKNSFENEIEKLEIKHGKSYRKQKVKFTTLIQILQNFKDQLRQNSFLDFCEYEQNLNKQAMLELLQSNDQGCFSLILQIILIIFKNNKLLDKEITLFSGLCLQYSATEFQNNQSLEKILLKILNVFEILPRFKLITYKRCCELLEYLINFNPGFQFTSIKRISNIYKKLLDNFIPIIRNYPKYSELLSIYKQYQNQFPKIRVRNNRLYQFCDYQPPQQDIYQNSQISQSQSIFFNFTIIRMIQTLINKISANKLQTQSIQLPNLSTFALGKDYSIKNIPVIPFSLKDDNKPSVKCFLLKQNNTQMVILERQSDKNGTVILKIKYSSIKFSWDKEDGRKLVGVISDSQKKVIMNFEDSKVAYNLKIKFQDLKNEEQKCMINLLIKRYSESVQKLSY